MLLSIAKNHIQYNTFDINKFNAEPIREHIFDVITKHSHPSIQNQTIHELNVLYRFLTLHYNYNFINGYRMIKYRTYQFLPKYLAVRLTPIHVYTKNTKRPHSIYYTEDIVKYLEKIKKLRIAREEYYK